MTAVFQDGFNCVSVLIARRVLMTIDESPIKEAFEWAITHIRTSYRKDELAYLALTSKIELPIRDKVAFYMGERLKSENLIAAREWTQGHQRSDLAILRDGIPAAIFEFKAMYSFDGILKRGKSYLDLMRKDLKKANILAKEDTELYSVLLITHPDKEIGDRLRGIVKYQPDIDRAVKKYETQDHVIKECNKNLQDALDTPSKAIRGCIEAGKYFDINVEVYYWLVGPFRRNEDFSSLFILE